MAMGVLSMKDGHLDEIDRKILRVLASDGRVSNQKLAEQVNLSTTPCWNRVKALESEVKAYVDLHRAELDGKSRALNFGTVGYRVSSKLMLASSRVAEAIATLKVLGHAELIKTTETLDREALKRQPGDILQQVGAYIRTVDEFYYDVSSKEADA